MELAPFNCLFWNTDNLNVNLMVSVKSGVSLSNRLCYKTMLNYENNNKCRKLNTI